MVKISKCKKELARIISEHGGWRNGEFAAQDGDDCAVWFYDSAPVRSSGAWWVTSGSGLGHCGIEDVAKLPNWHQTILSRDEYFHLYPSPDADGWIEWKGGECPVDVDALVCCKLRSGKVSITAYHAGILSWRHNGNAADIIAYRLHKPEQVEIVEYNGSGVVYAGPVRSEFVVDGKPTIDQMLQDWRNADDFAKRKQAEAGEAAAMRDERWQAVQDRAGEMGVTVGLCESVAAEPEQVNPAKPVMTGKFRNAKIGSPKHYISNKGWSGEICDECGRRFGEHFDTYCNP